MNIDDLKSVFEKDLQPQLAVIEQERCDVVVTRDMCVFFGVLAVIIGTIVLFGTYIDPNIIMVCVGIILAVLGLIYQMKWNEYRVVYKQKVISSIIQSIDDSLEYNPTGSIEREVYDRSGLSPGGYSQFEGEDFISGKIGQTAIEMSEIHTKYKVKRRTADGKTKTYMRTRFRGMVIIADCNKHFNSQTFVSIDKGKDDSFLENIKQGFVGTPHNLVRLEDPEFERYFDVHSTNQVEARYLLTPAFMQRVVAFRENTGKYLALSFVDGKLFISVSGGDMKYFEPKLSDSATDFNTVKDIFSELKLLVGLIDALDLNTRIWSKA